MSDEPSERSAHLRAITITSLASLAGVAAAIGSSLLTGDMEPVDAAGETMPQLLMVAVIGVQLPIYSRVYENWGGAKDYLFVAFMTFSLWFVTWGVILTTGVEF